MNLISRLRHGKQTPADGHNSDSDGEHPPEKMHGTYDDSPIPRLTFASFIMGVLVSMGGFIFGYDTGKLNFISHLPKDTR